MKKILTTAAALAMMTGSAYASKARLIALGEGIEDNYFIEDSRTIFNNAAYAAKYGNTLMLELGNDGLSPALVGSGTTSKLRLSVDPNPKQMGGFLIDGGDYVYGAYLGNESNISGFLRVLASDSATEFLGSSDNQLDLFYARKGAINWGLNFLYSSSEEKNNTGVVAEDTAMAVRFGALAKNWEAYANVSLKGEAEAPSYSNKAKYDGKLGLHLGGSYNVMGIKTHGSFKKLEWDQIASDVTTEGGFFRYDLGAGKVFKTTDTDFWFVRAQLTKLNVELKKAAGTIELNHTVLPLVVGFEAAATSWLKFRGSVSHNLMGKNETKNFSNLTQSTYLNVALGSYNADQNDADGERTITESTKVNAGATLMFGNLEVDGLIGVKRNTGATQNIALDKEGTLRLDELLARVGMTYKF